MLLCEVTTGKTLETNGFNFSKEVRTARIAAARRRLNLAPDAPIAGHPELKEAVREIEEDMRMGEVDDLTGTDYDSFHMQSSHAPNPIGDVVHPDGYRVPCGEVVARSGGGGSGARDEIIVYDPMRVRVRYVLELRDGSAAKMIQVRRPTDLAAGEPGNMGVAGSGGADTQMEEGADDQEEEEPETSEDEDQEEEVSDDE